MRIKSFGQIGNFKFILFGWKSPPDKGGRQLFSQHNQESASLVFCGQRQHGNSRFMMVYHGIMWRNIDLNKYDRQCENFSHLELDKDI